MEAAQKFVGGKPFKYLDTGFWLLTEAQAKKLCDGILPRHGYERICQVEGKRYIVARTKVDGKMRWSIRASLPSNFPR